SRSPRRSGRCVDVHLPPRLSAEVSAKADAEDPARRSFRDQACPSLEYWIARLNRAMTSPSPSRAFRNNRAISGLNPDDPAVRRWLMGRYLLLWLLGVPIPMLVLIWAFGGLH